jgi:hypothetical protein
MNRYALMMFVLALLQGGALVALTLVDRARDELFLVRLALLGGAVATGVTGLVDLVVG